MRLEIMGELLVVHGTDPMHAQVQRILDGIADGKTRVTGPRGPWVARLDAALDRPCPDAGREFRTGEAALDFLREETGLPLLLSQPKHADFLELREPAVLQGPDLRSALAGLARDGNVLRAAAESGAIWLSEMPATELWIHRIPDAVFECDDPEAISGELEGLIYNSVDTECWDAHPHSSVSVMGSYVICRQTRRNQRGVAAVLGQVERALLAAGRSR